MNRKQIRNRLKNKFEDWLKHIDNEELREDIKRNTIITGGAIASMLLNEKVNDFDVYFTNPETLEKVAKYYVTKFNKNPENRAKFKNWGEGVEAVVTRDGADRVVVKVQSVGVAPEGGLEEYTYFEGSQDLEGQDVYDFLAQDGTVGRSGEFYRPVFMTSNAITLANDIQLITRFWGDAETLHENFDYVHCTNFWRSDTNELALNPKALESLLTKELVYVGSKYPLCSVLRMRKYIDRGFYINAAQCLKMMYQINQLDLNDPMVLYDQLIGVDFAYFNEVITILKKHVAEGKQIDATYLSQVLDEVFG